MAMIQGPEVIVIAIVASTFLLCVYLVTTVQGDLNLEDVSGPNSNKNAIELFIDLVNETRTQIEIHDDGNDFAHSIYNNPGVIEAIRKGVRDRNIKVRCLFNDKDEPLKILELARSEEFRRNIEIWYVHGGRQEPDTHYKIVDGGKLVHTSYHKHHEEERSYRLLRATSLLDFRTRKRISERYRDHFAYNLQNATRAA